MKEIFKPIIGHEGFYEVSNLGNVRSLINRFKLKGVFNMKLETTNKGYKRVYMSKPVRIRKSVHRLVAEAFIPNPKNKQLINHIDNDPSNNRIDNLEWCTYSENLLHAQKQGRLYEAQAKGGKVTSDKAKIKAKENALALIGKTINNWKVKRYYGLKKVGKDYRESLVCECVGCGKEAVYDYTRLRRETIGNGCRKCFSPLRKVKR